MTLPADAPAQEQSRLDLLYRASREISSRLNLDELLPRLLKAVVESTQARTGSILVFDAQQRVQHAALMHEGTFQLDKNRVMATTLDNGLAGWVVRHRQPALVRDTLQDPRWNRRPDDEQQGAKSAICVPLLGRERAVGVLTVVKVPAGAFDEQDLTLLIAIADQAGIAIENARLFAESERRAQAMRALADTAQAINSTLQLDEVLRLLAQHAKELLEVESAALVLVSSEDERGERLVYKEAVGQVAQHVKGASLELGQGIAGWVAKHNTPVIVPDVTLDPRFVRIVNQQTGFFTRAVACTPIQLQDRVIGVIEVTNPVNEAFDPETLSLLASLATLAGTAIVHAQTFAESQAAEARFVGLFQDSIDPILITNLDGIITDANRKAESFFGYSREELIGLKVTRVHRTGTGFLGSERFRHLTGGKEITYQTRITTKTGSEVPVEVHAKLIQRGGQEFIQWIQHDLSERIALEELRQDMVNMIVHDLRSPLGNIMSSLDVLKSSLLKADEAQHTLLTIATRSAARLSRLVDSLLDLRRLEAGQVVLSKAQTNLNALMADAVEQVQPAAESKESVLRSEVPPRLPFVMIDGDMIRRVIINLMDNAVKYTPRNGAITVTAKATAKEVTISVRDTGPGIPPAEHTRIFNKFARLQRERDSVPKGLGLGLAFCRLAVEAHGGRIWVDSTLGRGATFSFTLP
ncbi:MAG: GAF domain-containing protein, partial [Anaerolineales bacterium]